MLMLAFRGQTQAAGSREQLFSSSFVFSALFRINYVILSCFQGTGNMSHSSAVDLPVWRNLCSHDFSTRILLCEWFETLKTRLQTPAS